MMKKRKTGKSDVLEDAEYSEDSLEYTSDSKPDSGEERSERDDTTAVRPVIPEDIANSQRRAMDALTGAEFIQLREVYTRIDRLDDLPLLDAVWRALERCLHDESYDRKQALEILSQINTTLGIKSTNPLTLDRLLYGESGWDLVDQALQQILGEDPNELYALLLMALELWNAETCLKILEPELEDLSESDWANMRCQALVLARNNPAPDDWQL
jgi:hypothetical protein